MLTIPIDRDCLHELSPVVYHWSPDIEQCRSRHGQCLPQIPTMNTNNGENGAPQRTSIWHPEIIPSVNTPERFVSSTTIAVTTVQNVPNHEEGSTTQSFVTAEQSATPMVASLGHSNSLYEALYSVMTKT